MLKVERISAAEHSPGTVMKRSPEQMLAGALKRITPLWDTQSFVAVKKNLSMEFEKNSS